MHTKSLWKSKHNKKKIHSSVSEAIVIKTLYLFGILDELLKYQLASLMYVPNQQIPIPSYAFLWSSCSTVSI